MWNMYVRSMLQNKVQLALEWLLLLVNCVMLHLAGFLLVVVISLSQSDWYMEGMSSESVPGEIVVNADSIAMSQTNLNMSLCMLSVIVAAVLCGAIYTLQMTIKMGVREERQMNALLEAVGYERSEIRKKTMIQRGVLAVLAALPAWGLSMGLYYGILHITPMNMLFRYDEAYETLSMGIHLSVPFLLLVLVWGVVTWISRKTEEDSIISRLYEQ